MRTPRLTLLLALVVAAVLAPGTPAAAQGAPRRADEIPLRARALLERAVAHEGSLSVDRSLAILRVLRRFDLACAPGEVSNPTLILPPGPKMQLISLPVFPGDVTATAVLSYVERLLAIAEVCQARALASFQAAVAATANLQAQVEALDVEAPHTGIHLLLEVASNGQGLLSEAAVAATAGLEKQIRMLPIGGLAGEPVTALQNALMDVNVDPSLGAGGDYPSLLDRLSQLIGIARMLSASADAFARIDDGLVTNEEVMALLRSASDFGAIQDDSKEVLSSLLGPGSRWLGKLTSMAQELRDAADTFSPIESAWMELNWLLRDQGGLVDEQQRDDLYARLDLALGEAQDRLAIVNQLYALFTDSVFDVHRHKTAEWFHSEAIDLFTPRKAHGGPITVPWLGAGRAFRESLLRRHAFERALRSRNVNAYLWINGRLVILTVPAGIAAHLAEEDDER